MSHRIIIVDDHPLFRAALRQTLEGRDSDMVFEEAGDIEGLSAALEANRPQHARCTRLLGPASFAGTISRSPGDDRLGCRGHLGHSAVL